MSTNPEQLGKDLVDLCELATRVEGKGQLNVGKILRAAADAIARRQAFQHGLSTDTEEIISDLRRMGDRLKAHQVTNDLAPLLDHAADLLQTGEQSYLRDFPNPYVCRRCGEAAVNLPPDVCSECGADGQTFQEFEAIYWLSEYDPHEVMAHLAATPKQLERMIGGMSEETANRQLASGGWSAVKVITHLRDADGVLNQRVKLLLDHENPSLEFKAVFKWAESQKEQPSMSGILEEYMKSREETLHRLTDLPLANWWRRGQHEEFGEVTLLQQASYFAAHELTHVRQINDLVRRAGTRHSADN